MTSRSPRWLVVAVVLAFASCTGSPEAPGASPPSVPAPSTPVDSPVPEATSSGSGAAITSLPTDCGGWETARKRGEISFISGGTLYAAAPDGSNVRCIEQSLASTSMSWGPEGDRVLLDGLSRAFDSRLVSGGTDVANRGWSRPTGTSVLYVARGSLFKTSAKGTETANISFLSRHDEAIYHPAGLHIVSTGMGPSGYGVYIATNEGNDHQALAIGEDARRIFDLEFSHDGKSLFYLAEHEKRYDVHELNLLGGSGDDIVDELGLQTLDSSKSQISDLVVSEYEGGLLAYRIRGKDGRPTVRVWQAGYTPRDLDGFLPGLPTTPVGWLPGGTLVVASEDGDVYTWWSKGSAPSLLVEDTEAVAVRGVLPPPPDPPERAIEAEAVA